MATKSSSSNPSKWSPAETMCLILFAYNFYAGTEPVGSSRLAR